MRQNIYVPLGLSHFHDALTKKFHIFDQLYLVRRIFFYFLFVLELCLIT